MGAFASRASTPDYLELSARETKKLERKIDQFIDQRLPELEERGVNPVKAIDAFIGSLYQEYMTIRTRRVQAEAKHNVQGMRHQARGVILRSQDSEALRRLFKNKMETVMRRTASTLIARSALDAEEEEMNIQRNINAAMAKEMRRRTLPPRVRNMGSRANNTNSNNTTASSVASNATAFNGDRRIKNLLEASEEMKQRGSGNYTAANPKMRKLLQEFVPGGSPANMINFQKWNKAPATVRKTIVNKYIETLAQTGEDIKIKKVDIKIVHFLHPEMKSEDLIEALLSDTGKFSIFSTFEEWWRLRGKSLPAVRKGNKLNEYARREAAKVDWALKKFIQTNETDNESPQESALGTTKSNNRENRTTVEGIKSALLNKYSNNKLNQNLNRVLNNAQRNYGNKKKRANMVETGGGASYGNIVEGRRAAVAREKEINQVEIPERIQKALGNLGLNRTATNAVARKVKSAIGTFEGLNGTQITNKLQSLAKTFLNAKNNKINALKSKTLTRLREVQAAKTRARTPGPLQQDNTLAQEVRTARRNAARRRWNKLRVPARTIGLVQASAQKGRKPAQTNSAGTAASAVGSAAASSVGPAARQAGQNLKARRTAAATKLQAAIRGRQVRKLVQAAKTRARTSGTLNNNNKIAQKIRKQNAARARARQRWGQVRGARKKGLLRDPNQAPQSRRSSSASASASAAAAAAAEAVRRQQRMAINKHKKRMAAARNQRAQSVRAQSAPPKKKQQPKSSEGSTKTPNRAEPGRPAVSGISSTS